MPNNTVNPQITDAVTQTNVKVLGEAPAMAMGTVYQSLANAISLTITGSAATQQGFQTMGEAVVAVGVAKIMQALG